MTGPSLPYSTERRVRWYRARWLRWTAGVVLLAASLMCVPLPLPTVTRYVWIDGVSGMTKSNRQWSPGCATPEVVVDSPLALRFRGLGLVWTPDWRNIVGTTTDVFGRRIGSSHGSAPLIYFIASNAQLQADALTAYTDDDVRTLFRTMTTGTEAEQRAAIDAFANAALTHYGSASTRPAATRQKTSPPAPDYSTTTRPAWRPERFRDDIDALIAAKRYTDAVAYLRGVYLADQLRHDRTAGRTGYLAVAVDDILIPDAPRPYDRSLDWVLPGTSDAIEDSDWQAEATRFATAYNRRRAMGE